MSGLDLRVDRLAVEFDAPRDHTHRIDPIVRRAVALLAELAPTEFVRLGTRRTGLSLPVLAPPGITADFATEGDEEIARRLARTWLDALSAAG